MGRDESDEPGRGVGGPAGDVLTIACDCKMWLAAGDFFVTLGAAHLHDGTRSI